MKNRFQALVLDVDDTLVATRATGFRKLEIAANTLNLESPDWTVYLEHYGRTDFLTCLGQLFPGGNVQTIEQIYDQLQSRVPYSVFKSIPDVLEKIRLGTKVGILTNGNASKTSRKLISLGLADFPFDVVISLGNGNLKKPQPGCFDECIELLDCDAERIVYVGDSLIDLIAARNAGLHFWAVLTGTGSRSEFQDCEGLHEDCIFEEIEECLNHFLSIQES